MFPIRISNFKPFNRIIEMKNHIRYKHNNQTHIESNQDCFCGFIFTLINY